MISAPEPFVAIPQALVELDDGDEADRLEAEEGLAASGDPVGAEADEEEDVDSDDDEGWAALREKRDARRTARRARLAAAAASLTRAQDRAAARAAAWSASVPARLTSPSSFPSAVVSSAPLAAGDPSGGASVIPRLAIASSELLSRAELLADASSATGGAGLVEVLPGGGRGGALEHRRSSEVRVEVLTACREVPGVILDCGPVSRERFAEALEGAGTVVWAGGSMGVHECEEAAETTREVASAVVAAARAGAEVLVAGGAACAAITAAGAEPDGPIAMVTHATAVRSIIMGDGAACANLRRVAVGSLAV